MHVESHRKNKWIFDHRNEDLRGWRVRDARGEPLGRVADLLVDPESAQISEVTLEDGRQLSAHDLRIGEGELFFDGNLREERAPLRAEPERAPLRAAEPERAPLRAAEPAAAAAVATAAARRPTETTAAPRPVTETRAAPRTISEPTVTPRATETTAAPRPVTETRAAPRTISEPTVAPRAASTESRVRTVAPRAPEPATTAAARGTAARTTDGEVVVQLIDEELDVDKRRVTAGGKRVQTHVVSKPVTQQVHLTEERLVIERTKVDRGLEAADAERLLHDETYEVKKTAQVPVVCKSAHVVEEVVLKREGSDHDEVVRDKVRHMEVDVADLAGETEKGTRR
jgi:stress response protein YsnF/sporulation protein YlmC with PRC-barrel domain